MVMVRSGNDAFGIAFRRASNALDIEVSHGVGISRDSDSAHPERLKIVLVGVSGKSRQTGPHSVRTVQSAREVRSAVAELARSVDLNQLPIVLMDEPNEGPYRRKWVLVNPDTLLPRYANGKIIEVVYNPTA